MWTAPGGLPQCPSCEQANSQWERMTASQQQQGSPISYGQVCVMRRPRPTLGCGDADLLLACKPDFPLVWRYRSRQQILVVRNSSRGSDSKSCLATCCSGTGRCATRLAVQNWALPDAASV